MSYEFLYYYYGRLRHMYHYYIYSGNFNATYIIDNIYIGDVYDAHNIDKLNELNIKNVISAVTGFDEIYTKDFNHLCLSLIDNEQQNIIHYFDITYHFIDNIISKNIPHTQNPNKILIHCICGISRSTTILLAYLIKKYNYKPNDALNIVKKRRNIVNPNNNFMNQLEIYYKSQNN
jgi:protein-tyrosine phosphatase